MRRVIGKITSGHLWEGGKVFDLWSVTHFLFGVVVTALLLLMGYGILFALAASFLLAVAWEIFEHIVRFEEHPYNRLSDLGVTLLGSLGAYAVSFTLAPIKWTVFGFLFSAYTALLFAGWSVYRKRTHES